MGYFLKKAYEKNTGKEVKFLDKVKTNDGHEFFFMWTEGFDEVCVSKSTDCKGNNVFHYGKPEEYGLSVKEVEMPTGYYFAVYTYTMLDDDRHNIEPYDIKFHGFVGIFTKEKLNKNVEEKIEAAAEKYATLKENAVQQEILDILRLRRSSSCIESGSLIGVISGFCAIKVNTMPHTNYNFNCAIGDKPLIECIKNNYNLFREQVSRGNYRTAYPINLDEEGEA